MHSRKTKVKNQTGLKIKQVYILLLFFPLLLERVAIGWVRSFSPHYPQSPLTTILIPHYSPLGVGGLFKL